MDIQLENTRRAFEHSHTEANWVAYLAAMRRVGIAFSPEHLAIVCRGNVTAWEDTLTGFRASVTDAQFPAIEDSYNTPEGDSESFPLWTDWDGVITVRWETHFIPPGPTLLIDVDMAGPNVIDPGAYLYDDNDVQPPSERRMIAQEYIYEGDFVITPTNLEHALSNTVNWTT